MVNSSIFKSYDVRGIYPSELNEDAAYHIGRGFVKHTGAKNVVVGYDARLSSPALFKALTSGLIAQGADVSSIGQVPTECLYFAVASYDFDAGIMITASHNPKEYNGFKMMTRKGSDIIWVRGKSLLPNVKEGKFDQKSSEVSEKNILQDYINYLFSRVDHNNSKKLKVAIDASNGVMGNVLTRMKDALPIEMIEINFEPDGRFKNHSPNPLEEGAAEQIKEEIKKHHANFGIMFDADADRLFLVDEQGELVPSDVTRLLLAKYFLQKKPGAAVVYDLICSRAVPEFIKKWGGKPIKSQVGFVNIREALIKDHGIVGGEVSGHYCFQDYFYMDSGMMAMLVLLQIIADDGRSVSDMAKELTLYAKSPVINFQVENQEAVLKKVKERYADGKQDYLDGVTVEYENWWFNLRPSNTEPLLKLTIEADTQELLEQKKKDLSEFINKI